MRGVLFSWLCAVGLLLSVAPAFATHEIDHRYVVFGHVSDDQGKPLAEKKVTAMDATLQIQETGYTDADGNYEILLHLHDTNRGDRLEVLMEDQKKEGLIEFNPEDKTTHRRHRVDFGPLVAEKTSKAVYYWISGGALLGLVALFAFRRKKGKRVSQKKVRPKAKK